MAADTVPAAVPDPNDGSTSSTIDAPQGGLLGSLFSATEPARGTAFDLNPATAEAANNEELVDSSSSSFHADESSDEGTSKNSGTGRQKESVWRAWLLAGAERWKKNAGANVKRLEWKKAQAQARQIKEARQVTVNRSGGILGNGNGSGGTTNKSLNKKAPSGSSTKGPKNHSNHGGHGGRGPAGHSGGSGSRGSSGRGPVKNSSPHGSKERGGLFQKRTNSGGSGSSSGGSGHSSKPHMGAAGGGKTPASKTGPQHTAGGGKNSGGSSAGSKKNGASGAKGTQPSPGGAHGKNNGSSAPKTSKDNKGGDGSLLKKISLKKPDKKPSTTKTDDASRDGKQPSNKETTATKDGKDSKNAPDSSKPNKASGETTVSKTKGKPFSTRESREAGYRDGTRAAKSAAHVKAYRDGVRDGWTDTTEAADREKQRLDKAHQDRKDERAKDQPVNASSADYHQPTPIAVTGADASGIHLGAGATRPSLSRGEVRSLAGFQKRLGEKTDNMTMRADRSKAYEAHARAQTEKITKFLEQAKTVKGGDKLVAELTKLQEASQQQETAGREVHKRAIRGAEACKVLSSNADTRYGDIYRAAVDSADGPAELSYYRDLGMTHA